MCPVLALGHGMTSKIDSLRQPSIVGLVCLLADHLLLSFTVSVFM